MGYTSSPSTPKRRNPLGAALSLSVEEASAWRQSASPSFAAVHLFGEEAFAAWFPADWVDAPDAWIRPLDPQGNHWESYRLERGMELYYRFSAQTPPEAQPLMAVNAQRWLSPLAKRDAVHVYRLGQRLEIAAVQNGRLLAHNLFPAQTPKMRPTRVCSSTISATCPPNTFLCFGKATQTKHAGSRFAHLWRKLTRRPPPLVGTHGSSSFALMRIIRGKNRGKFLVAPKNLPVRPTTDMAKEGLFNVVENYLDWAEVRALDLFAGTGNISYEMASRGCPDVTSVDSFRDCLKFIDKTADQLRYTGIKTVLSDVPRYLQRNPQRWDFIFADPLRLFGLPRIDRIGPRQIARRWALCFGTQRGPFL